MRFLIKTVSGRQGYKSFKTLNEYVDFMTNKGHLIKDLKEADLPYTDKPVKLPKISKSNGWSEVSDFGEVGEEAEKGESLIASTSKSVMKDEANMEMSKSSEKADKPEMGLGAEKGDVDMSDFKSFEYEEPKIKSSETKSEPKNDEPKSEEKTESKEEDKKESDKSSEKKEDKEEKMNKHDKDIAECLKASGVELKEERGEYNNFDPKYANDYKPFARYHHTMKYHRDVDDVGNRFRKAFSALNELGDRLEYNSPEFNELKKIIQDFASLRKKVLFDTDYVATDFSNPNSWRSKKRAYNWEIDESIKDYLPRAGFIRDDDEDKNSSKMGIWGGQGTDEQLRKAKIIAKVKFANGDRMGRVTKEDLDNFDEFKAQYDEIYGSDELDEGWKDKFKKGAATLGVAGALASGAMANEPVKYDYNFNPNHYEEVDLDANDCRNPDCSFGDENTQSKNDIEEPQIKKILPNGMIIDQFGNEWTRADFDKLIAGENPFADGARNPNTEDVDESFDEDIAECLRAAGC